MRKGLQISYFEHVSKNLIVTLHLLNQSIVINPSYFYKVLNENIPVTYGCREISFDIAQELGFVFNSFVIFELEKSEKERIA